MPSGWNAAFPNDMIWDNGWLTHEVAAVQVALGVTRGGCGWEHGGVNRQIPFDGARVPIAGLDRTIDSIPKFTGTLLQYDEALALFLIPGATKVTVAGPPIVHTITPQDNSTAIVLASLIKKPTLNFARSGKATGATPGTVQIQFPYGFVTQGPLSPQDKNEGEIPFTIESRLDPAAVGFATDDPGFIIIITDPT